MTLTNSTKVNEPKLSREDKKHPFQRRNLIFQAALSFFFLYLLLEMITAKMVSLTSKWRHTYVTYEITTRVVGIMILGGNVELLQMR